MDEHSLIDDERVTPSLVDDVAALRCDACDAGLLVAFRRADEIATDRAWAHRGLDDLVLERAMNTFLCTRCGTLLRDPSLFEDLERTYARWRYDDRHVEQLRSRALADYQHDRRRLRRYGVRPGARLIEIGSYVGAFLDFATAEGCRIVGVDLNADLVGRARRRGHDAREGSLCAPDVLPRTVDGVWILNCFEELADLQGTLHAVRSMLRPEGKLVIRTPNAAFVAKTHPANRPVRFRPLLDANALLGVPFRRCLSVTAIGALLRDSGFGIDEIRGREFSSQRPTRHSIAWSIARPARAVAYHVASAVSHEPMHPWLDVLASRCR